MIRFDESVNLALEGEPPVLVGLVLCVDCPPTMPHSEQEKVALAAWDAAKGAITPAKPAAAKRGK